ncbi:MAG: hypothetical protein ACI8WB_003476 [Phenylobacterium sp.]|jgi:hypothetical protein
MLKQSLFELAIATSLSSDKLAALFKTQLLAAQSTQPPELDRKAFANQCQKLLQAELDQDYPRRFRVNELQQVFELLWPKDMLRNRDMPQLTSLFDRLMLENGDVIHYRDQRAQDYSRFMARFDPAVMVGWRLATRSTEYPSLTPQDMRRIVQAQQPMFAPPPIANKPVAENHTHLGGMHYDGMVLVAGLLGQDHSFLQSDENEKLQPLFRLTRTLLSHSATFDGCDGSAAISDVLTKIRRALGVYWALGDDTHLDFTLYAEQTVQAERISLRWLRQQLARSLQTNKLGEAWLWLQVWLWHCYRQVDNYHLRMAIVYLVVSLVAVRRQLIMEGQGLTRFVDFYNRTLRRKTGSESQQQLDSLKRLFQGPQDMAEIKVTPNAYDPAEVGQLMTNLAEVAKVKGLNGLAPLSAKQLSEYQRQMDRWHFCIHFLRIESYRHNPEAIWAQAKELHDKLNQDALWHTDILRPELHSLTGSNDKPPANQLIPTRWVRGLDVAGDENLVKTEVYAPALRWLRQGLKSKVNGGAADTGFHYSIHVGEDYAHPLSGLRHIDEAVRFCEMRAGDRFGHALALGIKPQDWVENHGEIVLGADEHLDNLVWAWHYACAMSGRVSEAAQVVPILERRIERIIPFVPWVHLHCVGELTPDNQSCRSQQSLKDITPAILFEAWQLRRNCHFVLQQQSSGFIKDSQTQVALPDFAKLNQGLDEEQNMATRLYLNRWQWQEQVRGKSGEPKVGCNNINPMKKVLIKLNANAHDSLGWQLTEDKTFGLINDQHSPEELTFFHALQDWLLDEYDQTGLIIEANPTSNVYIANVEQHNEHPVFRWYPPDQNTLKPKGDNNKFGLRRGPIKVCINTDDAGIMPTTLRTEFRLLQEAAIHHGVTRTTAEDWIERLRTFGIDEFNRHHLPVVV